MKLFNIGDHVVILDNIGYVSEIIEDTYNYSFKICCAGRELDVTSYDEQELIDVRNELLDKLAYL